MPNAKLPQLLADAKRKGWAKYIRNEADERAMLAGCRFDVAAAQRVADFFRTFLRHSKGEWAGQPFELLDWQREDVIYPLFGWKNAEGYRRFREAYVEIPKKNGKSTLAAGIGLYLLVADGEEGAEVYSAATDQQQAGIVHGEAVHMVDASPALSRILTINRTTKNIAFPRMRSFYRALSAEADNKEGLNASGIVGDEMHVWRGRKLWDALRYAFAARRQPLLFMITTAGDDMTSVCREQHDYAELVTSGKVKDERFFGYVCSAGRDDDIDNPKTWQKANPSLGDTISPADFKADLAKAKHSTSALAAFKRYRLNIWSTSTNPWLKADDWQKCGADFTEADLLGRTCYAALDLAKTRDMTALALVFPDVEDSELFWLLPYFWLPEETANDTAAINPYRAWAAGGYLRTTPGNVCDYAFIRQAVGELKGKFNIQELAYDPWNAEQLTQEIEEEFGIPRVEIRQGMASLAAPTAAFERLVIAGKVRHNRHPVLSWQAGHVQVRSDHNGNIRPVKPESNDHRKIDGIMAAMMGVGRAIAGQGSAKSGSVYENRGLLKW